MAAKILPSEYETLKACFATLFPLVAPPVALPPEKYPVAVLEGMEVTNPAQARKGLEMALNDIVEMASSWSPEKVRPVDEKLASAGLITLSQLRARFSRKFTAIVKRGSIRNHVEYYLVRSVIDGGAADAGEVGGLMKLLDEFESRGITG